VARGTGQGYIVSLEDTGIVHTLFLCFFGFIVPRRIKLVFPNADKAISQDIPQEDTHQDKHGTQGRDTEAVAEEDASKKQQPEKGVKKAEHGRNHLVYHFLLFLKKIEMDLMF
jgi:hypothetical protein